MTFSLKEKSQQILANADIQINGGRPWDIVVHDDRFYHRVLSQGSLGLGESYMDGWWDSGHLDEGVSRIIRADIEKRIKINARLVLNYARATLTNLQSRSRAFQIGERHYDIGNDLYTAML